MNLFILRHGLTEWNLQRRVQGRENIDLNEGGILQARACGESLKDISIDCIISSPLDRAVNTAKIIGSYHNIKDIVIMEEFTERDYGKLSGLLPEQGDIVRNSGIDLEIETREAVIERAMRGIHQILRDRSKENVLVVTHGGVVKTLLLTLVEQERIPVFLDNTFINYIREENGKLEVVQMNVRPDIFSKWYIEEVVSNMEKGKV